MRGEARSLEAVRFRGVLSLCAHPNALPFSSRSGEPRGLHIELGEALARELGVDLKVEWVVTRFHPNRVDCDVIMGSIADRRAQAERRVRLSRPYHLTGVALVLPEAAVAKAGNTPLQGFGDLRHDLRVGVLVGSLAAQYLGQQGQLVIPFGFEDDMMAALEQGEIEAAAVSAATAGYYNLLHPERPMRVVHAYEREPELGWAMAVGMRRADWEVVRAVNQAMARLLADGTVARVYARYGIAHRMP